MPLYIQKLLIRKDIFESILLFWNILTNQNYFLCSYYSYLVVLITIAKISFSTIQRSCNIHFVQIYIEKTPRETISNQARVDCHI